MLYQVRQYDDVITTEQEAVALLQKLAEDHSPGWSPRPTSPTPDENSPALCCRTTRTPPCSGVCVRRCPLFTSVRQNNAQWVSRADRSYLTGLRPELYRWWCSVAVWTKPTKEARGGQYVKLQNYPETEQSWRAQGTRSAPGAQTRFSGPRFGENGTWHERASTVIPHTAWPRPDRMVAGPVSPTARLLISQACCCMRGRRAKTSDPILRPSSAETAG